MSFIVYKETLKKNNFINFLLISSL